MDSNRSRRIDNAITRGNNAFTALVWLAFGIVGMIAAASGYGGVWIFLVGLLMASYAIYGFIRHVFFQSR